jgi:RNA-splicing ligase RtcB
MRNFKIFAKTYEPGVLDQLKEMLGVKAFEGSKVRIMPDVHKGKGSVIGFTGTYTDKIIPNVVGVDISCGMLCTKISGELNLEKLDRVIHSKIPAGREVQSQEQLDHMPKEFIDDYYRISKDLVKSLTCYREIKDPKRVAKSVGSLGAGNHFIELDRDPNTNELYLVIHTGSRNLGKQVADIYQKIAIKFHEGWGELEEKKKALIETMKAEGKRTEIQEAIKELHRQFRGTHSDIPRDLRWLEGEDMENYLHDVKICRDWSDLNRKLICDYIVKEMGWTKEEQFTTYHNYIDLENKIIRKGSVRALQGEKLIIPMNMRDGSLICIGKGNEDWNNSAPHGAGRLMSRAKAFENLNLEDFKDSMKGIYSSTVLETTLDEAPMVYKPWEEIAECIEPTVDIITRILPIYNFKASDGPGKYGPKEPEECELD